MMQSWHIVAAEPGVLLLWTAAVSAALCALLIRLSGRLPFIDRPTGDRWHRRAVPDSGGIAIFAAMAAGYAFAPSASSRTIVVGAIVFWLIGAVDDRLDLRPLVKLALEFAIAAFVVLAGVCFEVTAWRTMNVALTILWLVGTTNALNLIDNMDGLAAGSAIVIAVFRAVLLSSYGYHEEAMLCGLLAAACFGFILFNFHPARIFMGNSGSMFLGFALAALTITSSLPNKRSVVGALSPAFTFAYPIFDTVLVSWMRRVSGRSVFVGGCDHSSHRLASLGWDERLVVGVLWIFTALGALLGLLLHQSFWAGVVLAVLFVPSMAFLGLILANLSGHSKTSERRRWSLAPSRSIPESAR